MALSQKFWKSDISLDTASWGKCKKTQKQGVGRLKQSKVAYLLGKCLDKTFFE